MVKNVSALGFDNFVQSTNIQALDGLEEKNFDKFVDITMRKIKGDEATKEGVHKYLLEIPSQEPGKWNMFRSIYSVTNSTDAYYMCLMSYKTPGTNKFKIYNIQMNNSFKLAQNVLIVRNSQSKDGEFFSRQEERIERIDKTEVSEDDLKQVLDFFDMIAMNKFVKQFGNMQLFLQ